MARKRLIIKLLASFALTGLSISLIGCKTQSQAASSDTSLLSVPGCFSPGQSEDYNPHCEDQTPPSTEFEIKRIAYTTANGSRPDGRYGYWPAEGTSQELAEAEVMAILQHNNDTNQEWVDWEISEALYYLGNPCGDNSWTLSSELGSITVTAVRQGATRNQYDYDLLLTCFRAVEN